MANGKIVNFSFDTNDEHIRKEIVAFLFNEDIIDIEVKFIVNDDKERPHKIIKPAATTLIFYTTKKLREIADIIRREQPAIYNFAISETQVVEHEIKTIIGKSDLQDSADKELEEAIQKKKVRDEKDLNARIDNIRKHNASPNSIPIYKITSLK